MPCLTNRRAFLTGAGSGAAGWLILRNSRSAWSYQANEKLDVALVGVGRRGKWYVRLVPQLKENLVALCDVNRKQTSAGIRKPPGARTFQDYRTMLDTMDRQLDAVIVVTPDHTHAVIAAAAMKRGKHVYVEKPMAHDVAEARALRRIATERKVETQMGNQGMASDAFRRTLELIHKGAVGEIREAHVWYVYGGSGPVKRPTETPPVPADLLWDLWVGPSVFRPYHPRYVNGWGAWRDFGSGMLGGGGSHSINMAFKALRLGDLWKGSGTAKGRIRVTAEMPHQCRENYPRWEIIHFDIPARGSLPPARITWYNAQEKELRQRGIWQRLEKIAGRSLDWKQGWTPRSGSLLVGSKGVVHTNAHNSLCALLPAKDFPKAGGPPRTMPHVQGHQREWLDACKGGPAPLSNFDHAGPAMELLLAGNIATLVGQPLEFDPATCTIVNNDTANRAIRRQYRAGWSL